MLNRDITYNGLVCKGDTFDICRQQHLKDINWYVRQTQYTASTVSH